MSKRLALNNSKKIQQIIVGLCSSAVAIVLLGLILWMISQAFQGIVLNSLTRRESEFVVQTDALSNLMDTMVRNYGSQIFSSPAAALLREGKNVSDRDRISCLRELDAYVNSSDFLHSINIYNRSNGHIYSTDLTLDSASFEEFEDRSATALFQDMDLETKMKPIRRTAFASVPWREKEFYSFLFFVEPSDDGDTGNGVVMLNIPYEWYVGQLMSFNDRESSVLLNGTGGLIAASNDNVGRWAMHFRNSVVSTELEERESNYIMKTIGKKRVVCYYSRMEYNDWYYLHVETLDECLPGLLELRNSLEAWLGLGVILLTIVAAIAILKIIFPFSRIRYVLNQTGNHFSPTETQITELVQSYKVFHRASILLDLLEGRRLPLEQAPSPPFILMLVEVDAFTKIREQISKACPNSLIHRQNGCEIVLLVKSELHKVDFLCNTLAAKTDCSCIYSTPRRRISDIPECYEILQEMLRQRYWRPKKKIWSEEEFVPRNVVTSFSEKSIAKLISTLRSGDLEGGRTLWTKVLRNIRNDTYRDQIFAISRTAQLLVKVMEELGEPGGILVCDEYLEQLQDMESLMVKFDKAFQYIVKVCEDKRSRRHEDVATQITEAIDARYADPSLSLAGIADDIGMSHAYLGQIFRQCLGISVNDYLNQVRIAHAGDMLINTSLPAKDIALKVGFSNSKYFFVVFKKIVGVTPLQYRKRNVPL